MVSALLPPLRVRMEGRFRTLLYTSLLPFPQRSFRSILHYFSSLLLFLPFSFSFHSLPFFPFLPLLFSYSLISSRPSIFLGVAHWDPLHTPEAPTHMSVPRVTPG